MYLIDLKIETLAWTGVWRNIFEVRLVKAGFVVFLTIICTFLLGFGYYLGTRFSGVFSPQYGLITWIAVYGIILLQIAGPIFYRIIPNRDNRYFVLRWIMFSCMGVGASMILYTVAADCAVVVLGFLFPEKSGEISEYGVSLALSLVFVTNVVGTAQVARGPRIYHVKVPLPPALEALRGFRLAQVSDLHVGPTIGHRYARRVTNAVNALSPDAIALTGDLIDGSVESLREDVAPLAELRSRFGTFAVLGNHEFYWRVDEWQREFSELGFTMLNNEHRVLEFNGAKIAMAGVPDIQAGRMVKDMKSDPALALKGAPGDAFRILLAHQPASYKAAAAAGFHLQLSGHTHGGQFFPFTLIVRLAQPFVKGLHRVGENFWIYVNRGTGYWGPPIRFLVPPEITLITLGD